MTFALFLAATLLPLPLVPSTTSPGWATRDDLRVAQFATRDLDRLDKEWAQPGKDVHLSTDDATVRNKPIYTFLVMTGCHADQDGNCNVTATFDVLDPSGQAYGHQPDSEAWKKPPPSSNILVLTASFLGLRVEQGEKLGKYLVRVTTTDHVTGSVVHTEQVLTITEAQ